MVHFEGKSERSTLVDLAPAPMRLVYALLPAGMVVAALVVALMSETAVVRPGARASLRPRAAVPARLRPDVLALAPILVASWALGGLYLSLGPSVAASLFDLRSHSVGGLVVTLLCGTGAATAVVLRGWPADRVRGVAATVLTGGIVLTLVGVVVGVALLALAGTLGAGVGFGASALGCFGTFARIAAPAERGELFAAAYVISYLAFSIPAVIAGAATTAFGLFPTTVVYALAISALTLAAVVARGVLARRRRDVHASATTPARSLP